MAPQAFIINGAERVIVNQRAFPGVSFHITTTLGQEPIFCSVIPNRGRGPNTKPTETKSCTLSWTVSQNCRYGLLRALGIGSNAEILEKFGEDERLLATQQGYDRQRKQRPHGDRDTKYNEAATDDAGFNLLTACILTIAMTWRLLGVISSTRNCLSKRISRLIAAETVTDRTQAKY